MYYICNPTQIKIYVNSARKTASQIQRELGCDVLINGGLFDMKTWSPCCWLKVDGNRAQTARGYYLGWFVNQMAL